MAITQNGHLAIDDNDKPVMGGTSSVDNKTIVSSAYDPTTRRLLVDSTGGGGSGTVTSVSVTSANGFAGTVATATTTPAITLSTTVTGLLKGNGTAISAAVGDTDYQNPISLTTTGTSGAATFIGDVLNIPQYSGGGGGTPGGLNTQLQYNNAGSFGGITGAVTDGTSVSLTTPHLLNPTINGAGTGLATLAYPNTSSSPTLTLPTTTDTLTGKATTDTLTNKDLTSGTNTFPTFNQNTTGSAAKWTTARLLAGNSVDGSANVAFANKFIAQGTTDTGLSGAQFLGALGTGIVKNTTTTGVLSIASGADLPAMTATVGGAVPTPPNNTATFLRGDGTFATPAGTGVTSVSGTTNRITSTGGTTPVIDISATFEALLGKVASPLSQFASTTSAQLAGIISDETGSGPLVFATSPTLTTAVLGSSTATTQSPADNSTKVATTAYVDAAVLGQNFKEAALVATTANLVGVYLSGVFTYTATGTDNIDGVNLALGNRVLVKNQTTTFQNGIYTVTTAGALGVAGVLTRSSDANTSGEFKTGDAIFVTSGTANSATTWAYTGIDNPTLGTDAITYAQVAGQGSFTAGNGISITGNSIAIDTSVTVDKTTAQTLTNKTLTSPTLTTPALGVASATSLAASGVLSTGTNSGTNGQITLNGGTSGSVTLKSATAAGTGTNFQLPATNGSNTNVLQTDGSGNTSWVPISGSGTVNSGTSGQMAYYASSTNAVSGNANATISAGALTLGFASSAQGSITLSGSSGSFLTLGTVASPGGGTITLNVGTGSWTILGGTVAGRTLTVSGNTTLATSSITYGSGAVITVPTVTDTAAVLGTAQTFTAQEKFNNFIDVNNAVTVTTNAGTVPVTFRLNTFTNSSAATMAITMATTSAVDGQMTIVRIYDFSAVAQTIGWTNTENSTVSVPTTSNGSTTLPLIVGFMFNSATTKWRCIASA